MNIYILGEVSAATPYELRAQGDNYHKCGILTSQPCKPTCWMLALMASMVITQKNSCWIGRELLQSPQGPWMKDSSLSPKKTDQLNKYFSFTPVAKREQLAVAWFHMEPDAVKVQCMHTQLSRTNQGLLSGFTWRDFVLNAIFPAGTSSVCPYYS